MLYLALLTICLVGFLAGGWLHDLMNWIWGDTLELR